MNEIGSTRELVADTSARMKEVQNSCEAEPLLEEPIHQFSFEDFQFLEIMDKNTRLNKTGHFEMPLPLKKEHICLPNKNHRLKEDCKA